MPHLGGVAGIWGMQIISLRDKQSIVESWSIRIARLWRNARTHWLGRRLTRMTLEKKLDMAARPRLGRHMLRLLAADPSEEVRMAVIKRNDVPAAWRITMAKGPSINIARAWAKAGALNDEEVRILIERWAEDPGVGALLAGREGLDPEALAGLAKRVVNGRVIRRLIRNGVLHTSMGKEILGILLERWASLPEDEALMSALPALLEASRAHLDRAMLKKLLPEILKRHPKASFQVVSKWPSELLAALDTKVFLQWLASQDPTVGQELSGTLHRLERSMLRMPARARR